MKRFGGRSVLMGLSYHLDTSANLHMPSHQPTFSGGKVLLSVTPVAFLTSSTSRRLCWFISQTEGWEQFLPIVGQYSSTSRDTAGFVLITRVNNMV